MGESRVNLASASEEGVGPCEWFFRHPVGTQQLPPGRLAPPCAAGSGLRMRLARVMWRAQDTARGAAAGLPGGPEAPLDHSWTALPSAGTQAPLPGEKPLGGSLVPPRRSPQVRAQRPPLSHCASHLFRHPEPSKP